MIDFSSMAILKIIKHGFFNYLGAFVVVSSSAGLASVGELWKMGRRKNHVW